MTDPNTQQIIDWLDRQSGDKVREIARWCEHGFGELSIKQEGGHIIEINGFKYARPGRQDNKLNV